MACIGIQDPNLRQSDHPSHTRQINTFLVTRSRNILLIQNTVIFGGCSKTFGISHEESLSCCNNTLCSNDDPYKRLATDSTLKTNNFQASLSTLNKDFRIRRDTLNRFPHK